MWEEELRITIASPKDIKFHMKEKKIEGNSLVEAQKGKLFLLGKA